MLKRKNFTFRSRKDLSKTRRETYPMAPSGEKLLEAKVTCFSRGSLKDKSESIMLGMHFDISIQSSYSL